MANLNPLENSWPAGGENAWRLALVMHAAEYGCGSHLDELSADTCRAAIAVVGWLGVDQIAMRRESAAAEEAAEKGTRVERLVKILKRVGGQKTLRPFARKERLR